MHSIAKQSIYQSTPSQIFAQIKPEITRPCTVQLCQHSSCQQPDKLIGDEKFTGSCWTLEYTLFGCHKTC